MDSLSEADKVAARNERAVSSLHVRTGAPLVEVRRLFAQEFSRLELGAKVRSYLSVLTMRNVRAMLRRKGSLSREGSDVQPQGGSQAEVVRQRVGAGVEVSR